LLSDIAIVVAAPIIGLYPDRKEIVVFCGGIHLAKDSIVMKNSELCAS